MTFSDVVKSAQKFTIDNSPLILTAAGIAGTVGTAYLTGRATFKAADVLRTRELQYRLNQDVMADDAPVVPFKEKVNLVWKLYIPPALTCVATIASIVGANQIGTRRTAALAAAYTLSERAISEYKAKVIEKVGENKERQVRDEIAQDQVNANPMGNREVIVTGTGDVDCYDPQSGRYFSSSMEEIKAAMNHVNYMVNGNGYASLNDFYDRIGLDRVDIGDEIGWNSDKLLEIHITTTISDKNRPCLALEYRTKPVRDYYRFR